MQVESLVDGERGPREATLRRAPEFAVFRGVTLGRGVPDSAFHLRHALEAAWLAAYGASPALADMAAARAAAQFILAEPLPADETACMPEWVAVMAADAPPAAAVLVGYFAASPTEAEHIRGIWGALGTAEALMETGGDIRLARDPRSALNGYGCSHRPRPWAITFASSTASSSSERGYEAADLARLHTTLALLRGPGRRAAVQATLEAVRAGIGASFGLAAGEQVVLAASGTDTELLALALTHLGGADAPILNMLIAPEETGRGVPMAARGVHFAVDTALGHDVTFEAPIAGFRADTRLANVALRDAAGALRPTSQVEDEITAALAHGLAQGRRVILHVLDLSKTGLLAPAPTLLARLRARHGTDFDIVVDACQTRLSPASLRAYLTLDAVVLITGSKFFTGPPFAGAAILPASVAARLGRAKLPAGLDAYFGQDDFPAGCHAAADLPAVGNYGLALRWHAALAEIDALLAVPARRRAEILAGFGAAVRTAVAACPGLSLFDTPPIARHATSEDWERLPSIFTFSLQAPYAPQRCLNPNEARAVYVWLNTDLSDLLPDDQALAARICHIGQPVPLPQPDGQGLQGALRVSAGARLISGEPSHAGLEQDTRLAREFADVALVFRKIALILANWEALSAANPQPCYRAHADSIGGAHGQAR